MTIESKLFRGVSWMASLTSISQVISWATTILIARILVPADYGLMAMATVFSGYAMTVSELGLGHAVIQRLEVTPEELSSVFWLALAIAAVMAAGCVPLSYLTALVMHEPRVVRLTQAVAFIFLLNGLQIVPSTLLKRRMDFRRLGLVSMVATLTASLSMLVMARLGSGVWTLLVGNIILSGTRTVLLFTGSGWRPLLHFRLREARSFLPFGLKIAGGRSLYYVQEQEDKFFAGRLWSPEVLGQYTFGIGLAQLPTDKIVSLINSVSYPALAQLQKDSAALAKLYLNIVKTTAVVTLPLFVAGSIMGDDAVRLIFDPKWYPMVFVFRVMCLVQIVTSLNAINNFVHAALGKPGWALSYNGCLAVLMGVSFAVCAGWGLNGMIVPWITTYVVLCVGWLLISLRSLGIGYDSYLRALSGPAVATAAMAVALVLGQAATALPAAERVGHLGPFVAVCGLGAVSYAVVLWMVDRSYVRRLGRMAVGEAA